MGRTLGNVLALGSAVGLSLLAVSQYTHVLPGAQRNFALDRERCYGVTRAAKNDCGTSHHACAGQAREDGGEEEWIMLPAGTCDKLVRGKLKNGEDA
ncbi:MAG: DUF2282 domain-containing protein [Rhodocyclaceae bacterium]|nr:DUF2282 domain-containing protein [Rhodocyclaceae bacterium]